MYNLLELLVWGRRSRIYKRWIYGSRLEQKHRQELKDVAWLFYHGWLHKKGL